MNYKLLYLLFIMKFHCQKKKINEMLYIFFVHSKPTAYEFNPLTHATNGVNKRDIKNN